MSSGAAQCSRQDANVAWAIRQARQWGCTHLMHCDDDELFLQRMLQRFVFVGCLAFAGAAPAKAAAPCAPVSGWPCCTLSFIAVAAMIRQAARVVLNIVE